MTKRQGLFFEGEGGRNIAYGRFPVAQARGTVVVVPGYSETYLKYGEVASELNAAGYHVYILDHRGMGLSERLAENPQVIHVEDFSRYGDDLETFVRLVRDEVKSGPYFMLAHSTGGLIGASVLARHDEWFDRVAMTCPLFSMNTGSIPVWAAYVWAKIRVWTGAGESYVPGRSDISLSEVETTEPRTTHSHERYAEQLDIWRQHPRLLAGGPSHQWLVESIERTWRREELAGQIKTPVLLFQASEDDWVTPAGHREFCRTAEHCRIIETKDSRHELLMEKDPVRRKVVNRILRFFAGDEKKKASED